MWPEPNAEGDRKMFLIDDPRFRPIIQLMDNAKYAEALHRLDDLLPDLSTEERPAGLYWKIQCLASLGDWKRAKACTQEALALVDRQTPMGIRLELLNAYLLHSDEGPSKAALEIRTILDRCGALLRSESLLWIYLQAKSDLGNCLVNAGRYTEAIEELEEVLPLQDQPSFRYYIHFWLGIANHELSKLKEARDHFESAMAEAESVPKGAIAPYYAARTRYELALIAYKQHHYEDALRQSDLALAVGLQDPELLQGVRRLKELVGEVRAL
jgi:tetratricopeptide (TPR) repeat protein